MKIAISMPILDKVNAETMISVINLLSSTKGHDLYLNPSIGTTVIHTARNALVDQAYKIDFDAILFIDSDMEFPADTLNTLISHNKDIVGVLYASRVDGKQNVFAYDQLTNNYKKTYIKPNTGLVKTGAVGTGILFATKQVFDAVRYPYFDYSMLSEDISFCHSAMIAGFETYIDTTIEVLHIGKHKFGIKR